MYLNHEGYSDPTAGKAISRMMREYRNEQKAKRRKRDEIKHRRKVYVVSRFAGDTKANIKKARLYCRFAVSKKTIPFASHLLYPQFLNDTNPTERELGLIFGLVWLAICDEVWCFGAEQSEGMKNEIHEAKRLKKPIRYFTEDMEEIKHEDDR